MVDYNSSREKLALHAHTGNLRGGRLFLLHKKTKFPETKKNILCRKGYSVECINTRRVLGIYLRKIQFLS